MRHVPALLAALVIAHGAASQMDTHAPRVPDPIRMAELSRYFALLGLSDEQRFAVEAAYEAYLDDFEPLRREMRELAVKHPGRAQRASDRLPRETDLIAALPGFIGQVRELDDEFLRRVESMITPDQAAALPRIRLLRERHVHLNIDVLERLVGTDIADLAELVDEINLDADALAAIEPMLRAYELRLNDGVRRAFEAAVRSCTLHTEEAAEELVERIRDLRAMNRSAFHSLLAQLPDEVKDELKTAFIDRAYGHGLFAVDGLYILKHCEMALDLPDLGDAERSAVLDMRREALAYHERLLAEVVDMLDEEAIRLAGPGGAGINQAYLDEQNARRREAEAFSHERRRRLREILGERAALLTPPTVWPKQQSSLGRYCGVVAQIGRPVRARPSSGGGLPPWRRDPLVIAPMGREELADLVHVVAAGDGERAVIEALYDQERFAFPCSAVRRVYGLRFLRTRCIVATSSMIELEKRTWMPIPYSQDLRDRVLAACDRALPTKMIADLFSVSRAWVRRVKQRHREHGEVAPRPPQQRTRRVKIDRERLRELVEARPDATLIELRDMLKVGCAESSICRALRALGYTFKKRRSTPRSRIDPTLPSGAAGGVNRRGHWTHRV
jgi:transposase